ncbi:VanZ family protein [Polaribacter sejongensis]
MYFFGIIIEVLQQTLTTYRTGDYKDAIANTVGILLGFIIFNLILKKITVNSY